MSKHLQPHGILVVDDDLAILAILDIALRADGFAVWTAPKGSEAVEIYRRHHQAVDLVLLDVQMEDMDGPATLSALQAIDPDMRFLFMSGFTGKYSRDALLALGASALITKPFDLTHFKSLFKQLLDGSPPGDTVAGQN